MEPMGQALWKEIEEYGADGEQIALWWLGQMGFAVKLGGQILLIDPFLTPRADRAVPPVLTADDLRGVDVILGTHDHDDHIDRPAWSVAAEKMPGCRFVCPRLHVPSVEGEPGLSRWRVTGLNDGESAVLGEVTVHAVAAAHELLAPDPHTGLHPSLSYVLEYRGRRLLHMGDACLYEGLSARLRAFGRFDAMILPINGRDAERLASGCIGNMTYQEAVDLAGALEPGLCIPGHFDMFAHNGENPRLFAEYLRVKYPRLRCAIPLHGTCITL